MVLIMCCRVLSRLTSQFFHKSRLTCLKVITTNIGGGYQKEIRMKGRGFSIIRQLGLTNLTYTTAERQARQNFISSAEEKFEDMKLLASSWPILTDFLQTSKPESPNDGKLGYQNGKHFDPVSLAMEVQDLLTTRKIECLISGSLALATMTQPRMTKDVDFNVNLSEKEFKRLKTVFNQAGHQLSDYQTMMAKAGVKSPYDKEFCAVTVLEYKGIYMDIFLNTCTATQWAHESAVTINNRKFISLECLAYFKLFAINPKHKRYHKDMNDLVNIVETPGFKHDVVETRLIEVFGKESEQVSTLRTLIQQRDADRQKDPWWQ